MAIKPCVRGEKLRMTRMFAGENRMQRGLDKDVRA
jgi:hypothetical protein